MHFLGKPFFHSYGYGANQPVAEKNERKIQQSALTMHPEKLREGLVKIDKSKVSVDKKQKHHMSMEFQQAFLKKKPSLKGQKKHFSNSFAQVSGDPDSDEKDHFQTQQPHGRLPSMPKKLKVFRLPSEEKKAFANSYLQRGRLKRYLGSEKKMTWEAIERLNRDEIKGMLRDEFDPRSLLAPETKEDREYLKTLGIVGVANMLPMPKSTEHAGTLPPPSLIGKSEAKLKNRSPVPGPLKHRPDLAQINQNFRAELPESNYTASIQPLQPKSAGISNVTTVYSRYITGVKKIEVSKHKRGFSYDDPKARILAENQIKRNDQLQGMFKKTKKVK
jgi:hypothetical protein